MKKNVTNVVFIILRILFIFFFIGSFGIFSYFLFKLNIVPTKFLIGGLLGIIFLFLLFIFLLFRKKGIVAKILICIFILILGSAFCYGTTYLKNTYTFFKNTKKDYDTLTYSIVVLKESSLNTISDLKEKAILYLNDNYVFDIKNELEQQITYQENKIDEFGNIPDQLLEEKVDAIVLEESYLNLIYEEVDSFDEKTKIIYTFEIQIKSHIENDENNTVIEQTEVALNPFILYISGIDQWGNVKSVRGRSDVNILAVVNPNTNHILLVNTPRDYYVQLAGTTGLRDKLTHAGVYGIDKSIKTLENFYSIDIKHYLRVNFNTLIQVVDIIGGIEINSDQAFKPRNDSRFINKGWNHFDGELALAYARERYAYTTGDHHRGANQQQVITAIIEKMTSSSVLISKYNSILNALNGTFQTDMPMEEITSFIKYQLDKMPKWTIESYAVTGSGSMDYTYSMGTKYRLYVMEPNMASVNTAKTKIQEALNG